MINNQQTIEKVMTEANLIDYENKKLKYTRMWCYVQAILLVFNQLKAYIRKDVVYGIWLQIVNTLQILNILWFLFLSEKRNIKAIYVVIILVQVRMILAFYEVGNVL